MTRHFIGLVCVLGLSVMGCSETSGTGGNGGDGGSGGSAGSGGAGGAGGTGVACQDNVCPCTEAGIRTAIAEGGGPFTFDCAGPTTVVTEAEIVIDNDVILDGEGNLTIDGKNDHSVLSVAEGVTTELRGVTVTGGNGGATQPDSIRNDGTLTLTNSTVSDNASGGISNAGTLMLTNSTHDGGLKNSGTLTLTNSTVIQIYTCRGAVTIATSTLNMVWMEIHKECDGGTVTIMGSVLDSGCMQGEGRPTSNGYNIESPGDTCGFDQPTDQVNVTAEQLNLGPLQDNGGPTMTHALGAGSVAIDKIPAEDCVDADGAPLTTDQRGVARPQGDSCDVGAFELEVAP